MIAAQLALVLATSGFVLEMGEVSPGVVQVRVVLRSPLPGVGTWAATKWVSHVKQKEDGHE